MNNVINQLGVLEATVTEIKQLIKRTPSGSSIPPASYTAKMEATTNAVAERLCALEEALAADLGISNGDGAAPPPATARLAEKPSVGGKNGHGSLQSDRALAASLANLDRVEDKFRAVSDECLQVLANARAALEGGGLGDPTRTFSNTSLTTTCAACTEDSSLLSFVRTPSPSSKREEPPPVRRVGLLQDTPSPSSQHSTTTVHSALLKDPLGSTFSSSPRWKSSPSPPRCAGAPYIRHILV